MEKNLTNATNVTMHLFTIQAGTLRAHFKTHSGEKPNKCNQCEFASIQTGPLTAQLNTHIPEKQIGFKDMVCRNTMRNAVIPYNRLALLFITKTTTHRKYKGTPTKKGSLSGIARIISHTFTFARLYILYILSN